MASKKKAAAAEVPKDRGDAKAKNNKVATEIPKEAKLTEMAAMIEETDEMKLKMLAALEQPEPEDMLYPPELNAHLIEQLKIMTCENNKLRQLLFTKDTSIKELNHTVAELNIRIRDIMSGIGPTISSKSAGIISAKITALCKNNRHLVAEVEGYKTKNASLERKLMQMEIINKEKEKLDICLCHQDEAVVDVISPEEFKELNIKLASVNKRLNDSKKKNLELKNDIIAATKILQQELGGKFTSLKELTNDVVGWKGRAEIIVILTARVKELEEMLNIKKNAEEKRDPKWDHNFIIKELQAKRKQEVENALKESKHLKDENAELKRKLDATKCRIRILECDSTTLRQKMETFSGKSDADDQLINEQRNQIKTLELYYQEILKENTGKINKQHAEIIEHQKLTRNTDAKIDALRKQASEKAAKIEELRVQLLRYEECSLQSVFFTPMRTATDNEIRKLSDLVVTLNDRLDTERHNWETLEAANRKVKEKKKKLERKVAQLEEEIKCLHESRKGSRVSKSSLPKDQQFEFGAGTSLTKRKSSIAAVVDRPSESTSTATPTDGVIEILDKDELRYKLELTEEKLKSLEDKLKMVEDEKHEDFTNLTDMIQTSKQLFNEALMVLQKEKCICN